MSTIHPAQYSKQLIQPIADLLIKYKLPRIIRSLPFLLDPFAGLGFRLVDIAELSGYCPLGVEIEPAYVNQAHQRVILGDSTNLTFIYNNSFDAAVTSPVYPSGMADNFYAKDQSKRHTYIHRIREQYPEYELHPNNTAGTNPRRSEAAYDKFSELNYKVYKEVFRVLKPGAPFVVNTKDTVKYNFTWLTRTQLDMAGFEEVECLQVECPGLNHGANQDNKTPYEDLIVVTKPKESE